MNRMSSNNCKVVIKADRVPSNEHERRFNAPTSNEIAIVMVGTEFEGRVIIIQKRDSTVQRVAKTHRSYDALQYPILFWQGEGGYNLKCMQFSAEKQ